MPHSMAKACHSSAGQHAGKSVHCPTNKVAMKPGSHMGGLILMGAMRLMFTSRWPQTCCKGIVQMRAG